jgi:hypothetical protein
MYKCISVCVSEYTINTSAWSDAFIISAEQLLGTSLELIIHLSGL